MIPIMEVVMVAVAVIVADKEDRDDNDDDVVSYHDNHDHHSDNHGHHPDNGGTDPDKSDQAHGVRTYYNDVANNDDDDDNVVNDVKAHDLKKTEDAINEISNRIFSTYPEVILYFSKLKFAKSNFVYIFINRKVIGEVSYKESRMD